MSFSLLLGRLASYPDQLAVVLTMIQYNRGGVHFFLNVFRRQGSVFPMAVLIAIPCSCVTFTLKYCMQLELLQPFLVDEEEGILKDSSTWAGFMFLVGFLIVFRTSEAYSRFWAGCTSTHQMRAEWFDACSGLIAFCKYSLAPPSMTTEFQHTLVRLFSMLHAVALADIEDSNSDRIEEVNAFQYELIDAQGIDEESLASIRTSSAKVELVYQWVQQLIVEHIDTGVLRIPAPILSRAFQEIANGMCQFHEALKISTIPFPFPYAQTCDCLLLLHWFCTPLVVSHWVTEPWCGALFTFVQVFIFWSLNLIAVEIENPFGADENDIDAQAMQEEMNNHLLLLLQPSTKRTPNLSALAVLPDESDPGWVTRMGTQRKSFADIWGTSSSVTAEDESSESGIRRSFRRTNSLDSHLGNRRSRTRTSAGSAGVSNRFAQARTLSSMSIMSHCSNIAEDEVLVDDGVTGYNSSMGSSSKSDEPVGFAVHEAGKCLSSPSSGSRLSGGTARGFSMLTRHEAGCNRTRLREKGTVDRHQGYLEDFIHSDREYEIPLGGKDTRGSDLGRRATSSTHRARGQSSKESVERHTQDGAPTQSDESGQAPIDISHFSCSVVQV